MQSEIELVPKRPRTTTIYKLTDDDDNADGLFRNFAFVLRSSPPPPIDLLKSDGAPHACAIILDRAAPPPLHPGTALSPHAIPLHSPPRPTAADLYLILTAPPTMT